MTVKRESSRNRCSNGSIMDFFTVFLYVLVLSIVMLAYLGSAQMLNSKIQISQISRKYILRMETVGYLPDDDRIKMEQELLAAGVEQLDLSGTTMSRVTFGSPIYLVIRGKLSFQALFVGNDLFQAAFSRTAFDFEERKMSTAKN